jgi:alpha-mannosidase/mannosylglycerate hydrolase
VLQDETDGFALYNKGLYEIEITEDSSRTAALTLFRSFRNEVGQDHGDLSFMKMEMAFEYALDLRRSGSSAGEFLVAGEAWRSGVNSMCTDHHNGELSTEASFLNIDIPGVVLSAFKTGRDGMKVIRMYNCTDKAAAGVVKLGRKPGKVMLLNLNEEVQKELQTGAGVDGMELKLELGAAKILTIGLI